MVPAFSVRRNNTGAVQAQKMPKLLTNPLTSARRQMDLSVVSEAFFRPEKAEAASVMRRRPVYRDGNAVLSGFAYKRHLISAPLLTPYPAAFFSIIVQ